MATQGFVDWRGNPINTKWHGGVRATYFIYFMVVTENIAFVSNAVNLVSYLRDIMHTGIASSSTMVTNFIGASCAFALLGAFLSDSYITRFKTILIFGPFEFLGLGLLAIQAHLPSLRPPECNIDGKWNHCAEVHGYNALLLYVAMYTFALGEGCVRACLASLGGDQFSADDPVESQLKSSFFNWFTVGISLGSAAGLILIVWIENSRWDIGFGVSALIVLIGVLVLASGLSFYRYQNPSGSPLTRMLQVFVAAFRNRKLTVPENLDQLQQNAKEDTVGTEVLSHTHSLTYDKVFLFLDRFLDKASVSHGDTGPWSVCTVNQVEETKIVLRMLPIFISSVLGYMPVPLLLTFTVQQGSTMDTKLGKIHISPASLLMIPAILQTILLVAYDRYFVPFARRITGYANGITHLQRVGVGFVSISLATCVAVVVERKRKSIAEKNGVEDFGTGVPMSVLWLGLQYFFLSINDATTFVGLLEFFNSEASHRMKSIGTAIFWCTLGLASLLGSFLVKLVNEASRHSAGERGWLEGDNLNKTHLDRFYWLLSALGLVAFLNHLYWARRYVYRVHAQ